MNDKATSADGLGVEMDDQAKALLDEMKEIHRKQPGESLRNTVNNWRAEHSEITDFTEAEFGPWNLSGARLNGLNLTNAVFNDTQLRSTDFNYATLDEAYFRLTARKPSGDHDASAREASFQGCHAEFAMFEGDFSHAHFDNADLTGAIFQKTNLRGAVFNGAKLDVARFVDVEFDTVTRFHNVASVRNCWIDVYALSYLGGAYGGLTIGNRMDMQIIDDVGTLRRQFSGVWAMGHLTALVVFLFPYAWFVVQQWGRARFWGPDEDDPSVPLWAAIVKFVLRGGDGWDQPGWLPNLLPLTAFIVVFGYNVLRAALLWKTKQLETQQMVSGLPVRFSLATSRWSIVLRWQQYLFWIAILFIAINTYHFLTMRVPV